jgi:hypothetical protein
MQSAFAAVAPRSSAMPAPLVENGHWSGERDRERLLAAALMKFTSEEDFGLSLWSRVGSVY